MLTEDTHKECVHLDESDKEFKKFNKPARIFGWTCGLSLLIIMILFQPNKLSDTAIEVSHGLLIIAAIMLVLGIIYSKKSKPYKIQGTKAILLNFYRSYKLLENYKATKIRSRQENARRELRSALNSIANGWPKFKMVNTIFKDVTMPLDTLITNFNTKFIPSIITDDESENNKNIITLESLIQSFSQNNNFDFSAINSLLDVYPVSTKQEVAVYEYVQKNPLARNILLWSAFVGIGGIVTMISHFAGGDNQTLIIVWVTVSTAAVTVYYTAIKKRLNSD